MQAAVPEDVVSRVRKALDLFQNGGYREFLTFDEVVPLVNTSQGKDFSPFLNPKQKGEVVDSLRQLEKDRYPIQIDLTSERIRFTQYPKSRQQTPEF